MIETKDASRREMDGTNPATLRQSESQTSRHKSICEKHTAFDGVEDVNIDTTCPYSIPLDIDHYEIYHNQECQVMSATSTNVKNYWHQYPSKHESYC